MQRVRFRNGAEAPEIVLPEKFGDKAAAKDELEELVRKYGTVEDAAAWLDGEDPPKHLLAEEEKTPVSALRRHRASRKKASPRKSAATAEKPAAPPVAEPEPDTSSAPVAAKTQTPWGNVGAPKNA